MRMTSSVDIVNVSVPVPVGGSTHTAFVADGNAVYEFLLSDGRLFTAHLVNVEPDVNRGWITVQPLAESPMSNDAPFNLSLLHVVGFKRIK